jgi:hypothetical protein
MTEEKTKEKKYTEAEAHRFFAAGYFNKIWGLLDKPSRSKEEDELMVYYAHASTCHWLVAGSGLNHQRGEWMIARVYTVLGLTDMALRHAYRCLELTNQYADLMEDFDWAFAYECVARANGVAGKRDEALKYIALADEAGKVIKDEEDKKIFLSDFNAGQWNGMK